MHIGATRSLMARLSRGSAYSAAMVRAEAADGAADGADGNRGLCLRSVSLTIPWFKYRLCLYAQPVEGQVDGAIGLDRLEQSSVVALLSPPPLPLAHLRVPALSLLKHLLQLAPLYIILPRGSKILGIPSNC